MRPNIRKRGSVSAMTKPKVLIVEDNPMNLELATDLLEVAGFDVISAGDGERGIELARAEHPDIILMDIDLPGMNGLDATKLLKQDPLVEDVHIIALTAFAMRSDREKALAAGCTGCLTKPIDTRLFANQVAAFIEPERPKP